jgi:hypothetical protein
MFTNLLTIGILISSLFACRSCQPTHEFADEAPVKTMVFDAPFPNDLIYQATPDAKIIVGKKDARPSINEFGGMDAPYYEISGFEIETGKKLWQLPFFGEIVGQTETQILVYEAKTSTVNFVNPSDGQITRKVSPAPNPLASKNSLELGMAFTEDVYLTTKALYTRIWADTSGKDNTPNWENRREDESFKIGITAKSWNGDKIKWFLPPVKQIVNIEYRPVIFADQIFIINPPQTIDGEQTYQIVSLKTGAEIFRGATKGRFARIGKDLFVEQTDSFLRRFEPVSGAEIWKIEGSFHNASVRAIGSQITIAAPHADGTRTITLIDAAAGKAIHPEFEFPPTKTMPLKGCFLMADKQILCNLVAESETDPMRRNLDYWVGYDAFAKKILWRTDFNSRAESSLFQFVSDKARLTDVKSN